VKTLFKFGGLRMDQLVGSKKMFFKAIEWVWLCNSRIVLAHF
jgi:hypothetical protein